jgi:hypothetical protein
MMSNIDRFVQGALQVKPTYRHTLFALPGTADHGFGDSVRNGSNHGLQLVLEPF